jgi:hypothetical protein
MTSNEVRSTITDLKIFLDDIECKTLRLMDLIYQAEEKLCDIELKKIQK